jgi:hypothetical protein
MVAGTIVIERGAHLVGRPLDALPELGDHVGWGRRRAPVISTQAFEEGADNHLDDLTVSRRRQRSTS